MPLIGPYQISPGSEGQVLTMVGGVPTWVTQGGGVEKQLFEIKDGINTTATVDASSPYGGLYSYRTTQGTFSIEMTAGEKYIFTLIGQAGTSNTFFGIVVDPPTSANAYLPQPRDVGATTNAPFLCAGTTDLAHHKAAYTAVDTGTHSILVVSWLSSATSGIPFAGSLTVEKVQNVT